MTGAPIMTFVEEGLPPGRLLRLTLGDGAGFFVLPDDDREYLDIPLSEMRPYPAMDAMHSLSRICCRPIKDLINKEEGV